MDTVDARLHTLDRAECLDLLTTVDVGRIGFTNQALPVIRPVNFAVLNDKVVFRTSEGSKLAAATRNSIVAFQADDLDYSDRSGWSVAVIGPAKEVRDPGRLAALMPFLPDPWVPGQREHVIEITLELVSGIRILRG